LCITELGGGKRSFLVTLGLHGLGARRRPVYGIGGVLFCVIAVLNRGSCSINDTLLVLRLVHWYSRREIFGENLPIFGLCAKA
jgi:hypothetical protein